jgi:uncharacterized protein
VADTLLKLHVIPRGSRNEITGRRGDVLCVKITAPPVEGAANEAVVKFIAGALGVRRNQVEIVSGGKSREKTIRIEGMSEAEVRSGIAEALKG